MVQRLSPEPQQARRVALDDVRAQLIFDGDLVKVRQPALRRDHRPVGAEQNLLAQDRIAVPDKDVGELFRRPAAEIDIDVGLVLGDREGFLLPRE